MSDLVERLRTRCSGHPHAKIPWPHRDIHDAIAEIERLRKVESAARALADELRRHKRLFDLPACYRVRVAAGKLRAVLPASQETTDDR